MNVESSDEHVAPITDWSACRSVSIDEAARMLDVSRRTVYYRIHTGGLNTVRTFGGVSQRVLVDDKFAAEAGPAAASRMFAKTR